MLKPKKGSGRSPADIETAAGLKTAADLKAAAGPTAATGPTAAAHRTAGLRRTAIVGLLTALSVAGSFVKIPSVLGTPALDALPAYFAAASIGLPEGALVATLGHLATALTAGFPLSPAVHALAALLTAAAVAAFGLVIRLGRPGFALLVAMLVNGVLAPAVLLLLPGYGLAFFAGVCPSLLVASGINAGLAALLHAHYGRWPHS